MNPDQVNQLLQQAMQGDQEALHQLVEAANAGDPVAANALSSMGGSATPPFNPQHEPVTPSTSGLPGVGQTPPPYYMGAPTYYSGPGAGMDSSLDARASSYGPPAPPLPSDSGSLWNPVHFTPSMGPQAPQTYGPTAPPLPMDAGSLWNPVHFTPTPQTYGPPDVHGATLPQAPLWDPTHFTPGTPPTGQPPTPSALGMDAGDNPDYLVGGSGSGNQYNDTMNYLLNDPNNWLTKGGYAQSALLDPAFSFSGGADPTGTKFIQGQPDEILDAYLKSAGLPAGMRNSLGKGVATLPGIMELMNPGQTFSNVQEVGNVGNYVSAMTTPGQFLDTSKLYHNLFNPSYEQARGITPSSNAQDQLSVVMAGMKALEPYLGSDAYGALLTRLDQAARDWQLEYAQGNGGSESFMNYLTKIGANKWI